MAITFWRNVQRKLTTTEMDANFDTLVSDIANAGLSAEMPEGQIYIGDNTNTATLDTLDTSIVPETSDKRYQSDLQDTYNDATSSIQTQFDNKLDLDGGNANQDIDIDGFGVNAKHFKVNGTAGAGHIGLKHQSADISASASESSIGADIVGDPVWKNDGGAIDKLELQSNKDSTGGYVGLTLLKINFKNVLNTFTSFFTNSNTASRTYTFQNRDGIIADDTDLAIANNQVAVETWSTDANYTSTNTTAKYLLIRLTATLTATRQLYLPSLPIGSTLIVQGSFSATSNNFINLNGFVNGLSSYPNPITIAYGSVALYMVTGGYSTNKPQFIETTTALTASKKVVGNSINGGFSSSYTAPFTSPARGDLKWNTNGGLMAYDGSNNEILAPYDPINGWMDYRPSGRNIKYWNQV